MAPFEMRCIGCGAAHDMAVPAYACASCGDLLEISMDTPSAQRRLSESPMADKPLSVWRYRDLLPVDRAAPTFSRDEGGTPLIRCRNLEDQLGLEDLWIKFDGMNPTGSFKDRGMTVGISKAKELGMRIVTCASTGNTSASLAAYAGLAGLKCVVLIPEGKVALGKLAQAMMHGAKVVSVKGNFDQALDMVMRGSESLGMYVLNSVNPFRIEGQKTAAYEVCDQLGGSAPVARMFSTGGDSLVPVDEPDTVATAIRIGNPANWRKTVRAIRDSGGTCSTVSDEEILQAQSLMAEREGIFAEPAGAAALAGLIKDVESGTVDKSSRIVCVSTGHGLKDPDIAVLRSEKPVQVEASIEALRKVVEAL